MKLRHAVLPLIVVITLAGCSTNRLVLPEPTTSHVLLRMSPHEAGNAEKGVDVRTVGEDTHVTWLATGQKVLFKGSTGYAGEFGFESAAFRVGNLDVELTDLHMTVVSPQNSHKHTLAKATGGKLTRLFEGRIMIIHPDGAAETIPDEE